MIVPLIALSALGVGGYKGWKKYGNQIRSWLHIGHPMTHPPAVSTIPSANPSGGSFVDPSKPRVSIPLKGAPAVISPAVILGTTAGGNTISGYVTGDLASDSSTTGQHLFDYLHTHGPDGSPQYHALVSDYQTAIQKNVAKVPYGDYVAVNGIYDIPTAAALAALIGDPIPAAGTHFAGKGSPDNHVSSFPAKSEWANKTATDDPKDAAAGASGTTLYFRLRKYGHIKGDPTEQAIVWQFQNDVNASPMFHKHGLQNLTPDGEWGGLTQAALKVYGFVP